MYIHELHIIFYVSVCFNILILFRCVTKLVNLYYPSTNSRLFH
ncbi:hypothetical protein MtrunA17_Chr2g0277161 [Medicago truncatula]|uniref:Transmembrane protein n=1 Tax=Medicago truncatula TaxID=3880 RepID=A0A396J0C1_MEDTR|nr:hypothetical protein MtrunA17_Chr2g0277161 [Medicago truncatula]